MITKAPAKINLTLDVFGKRHDGFHEILTIFQTISLYDIIDWEVNDTGKFSIVCDNYYEIDNRDNILWWAVKKFFKFADLPNKGFTAKLTKNIPLQSGLGGGSSDAAAVIMALADMFKVYPPPEFYSEIGADVPFFTLRGTALGKGKGDILTPLKSMRQDIYAVILQGHTKMPTSKAFDYIDNLPFKIPIHTQEVVNAIYANDFRALCKNCGNVFEQVAGELQVWEIETAKVSLAIYGAGCAAMTGSGTAVYGLFTDEKKALICADACRRDYKFAAVAKFI